MIKAHFRSRPGLKIVAEQPDRLKLFIVDSTSKALGLGHPLIETQFETFGPLDDPQGHDWTLDVFAHSTPRRIDQCDDLASSIATQVSAAVVEHDDSAMGVVRLHLVLFGVAYTHGALGTTFRNAF